MLVATTAVCTMLLVAFLSLLPNLGKKLEKHGRKAHGAALPQLKDSEAKLLILTELGLVVKTMLFLTWKAT